MIVPRENTAPKFATCDRCGEENIPIHIFYSRHLPDCPKKIERIIWLPSRTLYELAYGQIETITITRIFGVTLIKLLDDPLSDEEYQATIQVRMDKTKC